MTLSSKSLAGPGYIILNAIRFMNIVAFLAVTTASVVMLVKTSTASKFFFFDAVSHVISAIMALFFVVSELSIFQAYFARNWPLLGPEHGLVTLGLSMIVLGINILGNLNKPATSQASLGLAFWRIVIASGILVLILGFFNLIASYLFRDSQQGITARQVRAHGAVAAHQNFMFGDNDNSISRVPTMKSMSSTMRSPSPQKPLRIITQGLDNLPFYHTRSPSSDGKLSPSSKYSRATWCTKKKLFGSRKRESLAPPLPINISAPLNINPQFAHLVQRPDSTLHPSRGGETETRRWF